MKLQGRKLSFQTLPLSPLQGDDVKLLQSELQQLGSAIPATEVASQSFGEATFAAVIEFQGKNGLATTGIVDESTAEKINAAVDVLQPQRFIVQGQVRRADGKPIGPTVVRAFAVSSSGESPVGEATTDTGSGYKIEYSAAQLGQTPGQPSGTDLIVRAFDASGTVVAASQVIRNAGPVEHTDLVIQEQTTLSTTTFVVRGQVRKADGSALPSAIVRAVDRDMRTEQPLGEAITDADGRYEIRYRSEQFSRDEKGSADLIVRVFAPPSATIAAGLGGVGVDTVAAPLVSSGVLFNAPPIAIIDLTLADPNAGLSEFERLLAQITPVCQGVAPDQFNDQDLEFLAGETGEGRIRIQFLSTAYQLYATTRIQPAVFYGLFREGLPTALPELLAQGASRWSDALWAAIAANIVPATLKDCLDEIITALKSETVEMAFVPPPSGSAALGDLLATGVPDEQLRRNFLTHYVQNTGTIQEFWTNLASQPGFENGVVENLQWTLWLGALARDHLPLVQELQTRRKNGAFNSMRDFAQLTENDWLGMINQPVDGKPIGFPSDVPGNSDAEKAANYVHTLARTVEIAFPTAVIAARISKENAPANKDLITFLANNENFDFGDDHVDVYLANNPDALNGVADPKTLLPQLKGVQRVFTVTPRYAEMKVLLDDGLKSAQAMTRMSRDQFLSRYNTTLGQDRATKVYDRASQVAAAALLLYGKYSQRFSTPLTVIER